MIQRNAIIEWREVAPWKELRFVEQDLIISRALIAIFQDEYLRSKLAFRGGTALYKLFLTQPIRYSEDIDFVQINAEPIGEVLDRIKPALSFLGDPRTAAKAHNNTLVYRMDAEDPPGTPLRLKVEINCREHFSIHGFQERPYSIKNQWFSGECGIVTYRFDELIGTKIRALYQRKKGRDLFDLNTALQSGLIDVDAAVDSYRKYMVLGGFKVPSATEYAENLEAKMKDEFFRIEILPFLAPSVEYDAYEAHKLICNHIIDVM